MINTKNSVSDFGLLGGAPLFRTPVSVGQMNSPSWEEFESTFRALFERQYYTNHGPLVQAFEQRLQDYLGVKHVVCVTNATIGIIMAAEAVDIKGKVVVPSFTSISTVQALTWAGLEPVFCDVDPETLHPTIQTIEPLINSEVSAILGVNLWGGSCSPLTLHNYAREHNLRIFFDSTHAMGCEYEDTLIGNFGDMEIFSFHGSEILGCGEGGCIATNDDHLAAKLRNIRSSYGAGAAVEVVKTSNGRMSEAQAALGILSLDKLSKNILRNEQSYLMYAENLDTISGLEILPPRNVSRSNYQAIVCKVDESQFGMNRDQLLQVLLAENIFARRDFYPGAHRSPPYNSLESNISLNLPNTDSLTSSLIQLPVGSQLNEEHVALICRQIKTAHFFAFDICNKKGD